MEGLPSPEEQAKAFGLPMKAKSVPVGKYLVNGEIIKFGKSELAVLSVPGHSPGGVAFYNKKNGFVIVGDSLFAGSIGRTDLWGATKIYCLPLSRTNYCRCRTRPWYTPPWPRDTNH